jgi:hypothetical protein
VTGELERRAGAPWRILVHSIEPDDRSGDSWHVASDRRFGGGNGEDSTTEYDGRVYHSRHVEIPGTDFDELVIGRWAHLEQMDTGTWWLAVGGVVLFVTADPDGNPKSVSVYGPGCYDEPVRGVDYHLTWGDE